MKKRVLALLLVLIIIGTATDPVAAAPVIADDSVIMENADYDISEGYPANEAPADEVTAEEVTAAGAGELIITAITPPDPDFLLTEHKLALERLLEKMPQKLDVTYGNSVQNSADTDTITGELTVVTWESLDDYDERLGTYIFTPVFDDGVVFAEGVVKPEFTVTVEHEEDGATGGYIPDQLGYEIPIVGDPEVITSSPYAIEGNTDDSYYNGYEEGKLPSIRDQGSEGACWAFASLGALEMDLVTDGADDRDEIDLSELQLAYFTSHKYNDPKGLHNDDYAEFKSSQGSGMIIEPTTDYYLSNGGNAGMAFRAMANMVGPVDEAYVPYYMGTGKDKANYHPDEVYAVSSDHAQMKGAYLISPADRAGIKAAIKKHGAVAVSIYSTEGDEIYYGSDSTFGSLQGDAHYSATYNSYYSTVGKTDHAVMAVGWDDNFPKEHFQEGCRPEEDGAWLIRNSWGLDDYGKSGYFWLSYYDMSLLSGICVAYDADHEIYDHVYSYDGTAFPDNYAGSTEEATVVQHYPVSIGETIKAVGVEVGSADLMLEVTVKNGEQTASGNVETTFAGFYMVELSQPMLVTTMPEGEDCADIEVSVRATTSGTEPILFAYDKPTPNTYWQGQINYHSEKSGGGFSINGEVYEGDARIKVYTDDTAGAQEETLVLNQTFIHEHADTEVQLELKEGSAGNIADFTWSSLDEKVATVSADGLVKVGKCKGTTMVTGTNGAGVRLICKVTVKPYKITYHDTEGVIFYNKMTEFYPGDDRDENSWKLDYDNYEREIHKQGYAWPSLTWDAGHKQPVSQDDLKEIYRDVDLYVYCSVVCGLQLNYYPPTADLSGYDTTKNKSIDWMIQLKDMPYVIPAHDRMNDDPQQFAPAGSQFTGFSLDPEGKKPINVITPDIGFNLRWHIPDRWDEHHYTQNWDLYLYPQYGEKKPQAGRVRILKETEDLTGKTISLDSGNNAKKTVTLTAVAEAASGDTWTAEGISQEVLWKSSAPAVAMVEDGVVTAVSNGTATVSALATDGSGKSAQVTVRVSTLMQSLTITGPDEVSKGRSIILQALPQPEATSNKGVTWSSDATGIARVDTVGRVTGVSGGEATITATAKDGSGVSATKVIRVTVPAEKGIIFLQSDPGQIVSDTTIGLDPDDPANVSVSLQAQFLAKNDSGTFSDTGVSQVCTWKSANDKVASVDENGVVTAVGTGTAVITATAADGSNKSAKVTINSSRLVQEIRLTGPGKAAAGKAITLTATVLPDSAKNKTLDWKCTDTAKATVANGRVTVKAGVSGEFKVIASAKDGSGISSEEFTITVMKPAETIRILRAGEDETQDRDITNTTIGLDPDVGKTLQLKSEASATGAAAGQVDQTVTWKSANLKVATVDEYGLVTAVGPGTSAITATAADGTNKSAKVTVNVATLVQGITLEGESGIGAGKSTTLTATITPDSATNKNLTWSVDKANLATVANGRVTIKAGASGTVRVTATAKDGSVDGDGNPVKGTFDLEIIPAVEKVTILKGGQPAGKSIEQDLSTDPEIELTAECAGKKPGDEVLQTVSWKSSNTRIATVDDGTVTLLAPGTATITATAADGSNKSASVSIKVTQSAITITGPEEVAAGKSAKLTAQGPAVNWTIDSIVVGGTPVEPATRKDITVSAAGLVAVKNTVAAGTVITVKATSKTDSTKSGTHTVTVKKPAGMVVIKRDGNEMPNNGTIGVDRDVLAPVVLSAEARNADGTADVTDISQIVTWKTSNAKVAGVDDNGVVKPLSAGTARITATTADGMNRSASVTINVAALVTDIDVKAAGDATMIAQGKALQFTAAVKPVRAANKNVLWYTGIPNYDNVTDPNFNRDTFELPKNAITISTAGRLSVSNKVPVGTSITVWASAKDGSGVDSATCTITVTKPAARIDLFESGKDQTKESNVQNSKKLGLDRDNLIKDPNDAESGRHLSLTARLGSQTAFGSSTEQVSQEVIWTTSNAKVATVDQNGVVTSLAAGTAQIKATAADGSNKSATVTINVASLVTSLEISGPDTVTIGNKASVTAKYAVTAVLPARAADKKVTWAITEIKLPDGYTGSLVSSDVRMSAGTLTVNKKVPLGTQIRIIATASDGSRVTVEKIVRVE